MSEILAKVYRGDTVESVHRGDLIVRDGRGEIHAAFGDPGEITFYRSAAKPLQALPFILSGAADAYGFTEREIALACASHSGEKFHTELAARMLDRADLGEADLGCGAHLPFDEETATEMIRYRETPNQMHNNCSGKHAAMLAFARHVGADPESYLEIDSPVQQAILLTIAEFAGVPQDEIRIAVDGCSAPNFAVPLTAMARSFARLIAPPAEFADEVRAACRRIVLAMANHPELVGGTERLDTLIMQAAGGRAICKVGAEGVWLAGILPDEQSWPHGLSIALKIRDGDDKRARPAVAVELMRRLGVIAEDALVGYSPLPVKTRRNLKVGEVVSRKFVF